MLSLHNVGSAGQALHYFSKDNYYTTDQGLEHSAWFGKGAAALGLNGQVDRDAFFKLLSGRVGTQQLGRVALDDKGEPEVIHRPGIDLTFSAPKSVSIAAEVFEDHHVRHAHEEAVKEALAYVEAVVAQARKTEDGQTLSQDTGNIVAALFRHNTSRDLERIRAAFRPVMPPTPAPAAAGDSKATSTTASDDAFPTGASNADRVMQGILTPAGAIDRAAASVPSGADH